MDECKHSSKASGATPAGALTRPRGGNFILSRTKICYRGGAHPYTFGRPLREGEGDFIALCKQRLQRVTGSKPSKSTNTLPPAWQFSLSWGGVNDEEEHQAPGWCDGQATRDCEEQPPDRTGPAGCPPRKLSSSISSIEDPVGVKLANNTLHAVSLRATLSPGGRYEEQPPNMASAPWSGISIPLQARGHRRSRTPRAQCSSVDPTEAKGW